MSYQPPQRPEIEFWAGTITAAIWQNEQERNGETLINRSIRIQKRYFDRDLQKWADSDVLFPEDLPRLGLVTQKAYEYITLRQRDPNAPVPVDPESEIAPDGCCANWELPKISSAGRFASPPARPSRRAFSWIISTTPYRRSGRSASNTLSASQ